MFTSVMRGNVGKNPTECIELMFTELQDMQVSIPDE